jgi:hypothetical protein
MVVVGPIPETKDKQIVPLLVSRYDLVVLNDFREVTLPVLRA